MTSLGAGGTVTVPIDRDVGTTGAATIDLSHERLRAMFELMLLARALDERIWTLNRAGRVSFAISCQGHEGAQAGVAFALDTTKDWLYPYYRDLALVLHWGMTPREVMLFTLSRKGEPNSGGRQMPGHYGCRRLRIVTSSSPVATQIAQAPGTALASKIRGEDVVTLVCVGEGGTAEGDFHEGLNWASIHKLPVIFFVQNNRYAISVPMEREMAVPNVADRAVAYNMPGVTVDGMDALAVYAAAKQAAERARRGDGPTLIEADVYRYLPHSSDDDDRSYRSREEVAEWRQRDPLVVTRRRLRELGALNDEQDAEMQARVKAVVNDATDYAEAAPLPDPADAFTHVYAER